MYKTVFILGAGASADAGCPTMASFLDRARTYLATNKIEDRYRASFEGVFEAIYELQGIHFKSGLDLNNIEEVFGAVDMAKLIDKLGRMSRKKINELYTYIQNLIIATLDQSVKIRFNGTRFNLDGSYHKFAEMLSIFFNQNSYKDISILTFNYDVALDYALELQNIPLNYHLDLEDKQSGLPLLKLHGSLNWGSCKTCKGSIFPVSICDKIENARAHNAETIPLNFGTNLGHFSHSEGHYLAGPIIVPPTWTKSTNYRAIKNVWRKAAQILGEAEAIYIVGYSLPSTDTFFRYLFSLGTHSTSSLVRLWVFDPDEEKIVRPRYDELIGPGLKRPRYSFFNEKYKQAIIQIWNKLAEDKKDLFS